MATKAELEQQQADISIFYGLTLGSFVFTPLAIMFVRFMRHPTHGISAMFTPLPRFSKVKSLASQMRTFLYAHSSWGYLLDLAQAVCSGISCLLYIVTSYAMIEYEWVTDVEVRVRACCRPSLARVIARVSGWS